MRAHPYREKRRTRHDRRVAARLKRKALIPVERSGALVPISDVVTVVPPQTPSARPVQTVNTALAFPRLYLPETQVLKPSPIIIYSEADLRRLNLIMLKRKRKSQTLLSLELQRAA
jgi:hypothetical protein